MSAIKLFESKKIRATWHEADQWSLLNKSVVKERLGRVWFGTRGF